METTIEAHYMKKLLFLLPVIALSACSSGANYGQEVTDNGQAETIYNNILINSQTPTNYVIDQVYKTEVKYTGANVSESSEERCYAEVTPQGYFHFKYTEKNSEGGMMGSSSTTTDYYYGMADGQLISYLKITMGGYTLVESATLGYGDVPTETEKMNKSMSLIYPMNNGVSLADLLYFAMTDFEYPELHVYSKNNTSLAIVANDVNPYANQGQTPMGGGLPIPASSSSSKSKSEIIFENGRIKKINRVIKVSEDYVQATTTSLANYSYPQNLTINIPSGWRNALDNGWY